MVRHNKVTLIKKLAAAAAVSLAFVGAAKAAPEAINIGPNGETITSDNQYGNQAISANGSVVIIQGAIQGQQKSPLWSRDRQTHSTQMLSKTVGGQAANSYVISGVSANGRYVAFDSFEDNLVSGDTNGTRDSFVIDRNTGLITQVNVANAGAQTGYSATNPGALSADGRYVAFQSGSQALLQSTIPDNNNAGIGGVYVRDLVAGTTKRINVTSDNTNGTPLSYSWPVALFPQISGDGRFVAFFSPVALAPNGIGLYVRDQLAGTTSTLPISAVPEKWTISANGRYLAYYYNNAGGGNYTVNVLDRQSNTVETIYRGDYRIEAGSNNILADRRPVGTISMSANGRYVTFGVADSQEGTWGTNVSYVFDRQTRQIANLADYGAPGRPQTEQERAPGMQSTVSGDGRHILVGRVALANPLFQDDGFCSMYNPYISE